jgi:Domain of unknown function (DUF1996)
MFKTIASRRLRLTLMSTLVLAACGGGGGATEAALSADTTTNTDTGSSGTPSGSLTYIDRALALPTGRPGTLDAKVQPAMPGVNPYPANDGTGAFRTVCFFSHMSYDDPILYPGGPGRAHLHSFFGNKNADANSTTDSIANQGASTCRGGILNRSSYWVPSMIAPGGVPMAPHDIVVYYKTGYQGLRNDQITVPPVGLRIIGGNSKATSPQPYVSYGCAPFTEGDVGAPLTNDRVPNCVPGQQMMMRVEYPQCWDGRNLTSPDGRSHMAYGTYAGGRGCPSTHPVPIPAITFTVKWRVPNGMTTANWRLSSDVDGAPAGSSGHADWWNGWDLDTKTTWVERCNNIGMDCGTYLLGDGRMLED